MHTAIKREQLEEMLDQAVREVTEKTVGVQLHLDPAPAPPEGELCTIHITFKKGFHSSLSLCADMSMLKRMTRAVIREERITTQDLEDFSKEYFNILCGRIAALLFQATKVPARFSVPSFHLGRFEPEGQRAQFALTYANDQREGAQLIHHVPCHGAESDTIIC